MVIYLNERERDIPAGFLSDEIDHLTVISAVALVDDAHLVISEARGSFFDCEGFYAVVHRDTPGYQQKNSR